MIGTLLFLLIGGIGCIWRPSDILAASGVTALSDEPAMEWFLRILGVVLVAIACWALYGRFHS